MMVMSDLQRRNPHNPFAAPGYLEVLRRFVNTLDVEGETDVLDDRGDAQRWLRDWGLLDPEDELPSGALTTLRAFREATRALLRANEEGGDPPGAELELFNERLSRSVRVSVVAGRLVFEPEGRGSDAALARLCAIAADALAGGSWARLKVCHNDRCRWAFYDASRNRTSRWCRMETCGNRAKARRYRERHGSTAVRSGG
jgi:predicted RNA-binding Zn ribbon-like protein